MPVPVFDCFAIEDHVSEVAEVESAVRKFVPNNGRRLGASGTVAAASTTLKDSTTPATSPTHSLPCSWPTRMLFCAAIALPQST
jgi:hypothetical protein